MGSITISSKYQIVLPKEVRDRMQLKPGEKLVTILKGKKSVTFVKVGPIKEAFGLLKEMNIDDIRDRSERFD